MDSRPHSLNIFPTRISIFPGALVVDDFEESVPGGGVGPHSPAPAHAVHTHTLSRFFAAGVCGVVHNIDSRMCGLDRTTWYTVRPL